MLAIIGLFLSPNQTAQAGALIEDTGSWLQMSAEGSLKSIDPRLEKIRFSLEGQARFNNHFNHYYQGVVRVGLGYSLTDCATIWAGYTWTPTQQLGKDFISQQDFWQAFRYAQPTEVGTFTFRTLLESNFFKGNEARLRLRQSFRWAYSLDSEPRLLLIARDEVFYRLNSTPYGGESGFDQNRAFVGFGWNLENNLRFEIGYLNQYADDAKHNNNTLRHLITGSLFISF